MQTNYPEPSFAGGSHTLGHYSPTLITPGPGTRQPGTVPSSQGLWKLFTLSNPKPAYPASPVPSHGNHKKGCCSYLPSPLASWLTLVPLPVHPLLRICEYNQPCSQWHSPSHLWALLYLRNSNKTYLNNKTYICASPTLNTAGSSCGVFLVGCFSTLRNSYCLPSPHI